MDETQLAPVIQEIRRALPELGEDRIEEELRRYLKYGIHLQEAKNAILRRFGARTGASSLGPRSLVDLSGGESNFEITARCLSSKERLQNTANGEKTMVSGLIADRTMIRRFVSWEGHTIEKGRTYVIRGASARLFRGEVEISLGAYTTVEEPKVDPLADLDVSKLPRFGPLQEVKLRDVRSGMGNVSVIGKILSLEEKTIETEGATKKIHDGMIADDTKKLRFTVWSAFLHNIGDVLRIKGAYVKEWRGIPQLNFDERAEIELLEDIDFKVEMSPRLLAEDLVGAGATDVEVAGTILEVREGSGLIFRCPVCNRALSSGSCSMHGEQTGFADLRAKVVLDDGTGALFAVLNTEITEHLLCMGVAECEKRFAQEEKRLVELLEHKLLGKRFRMKGNVIRDDFGSTMLPNGIAADEEPYMDHVMELISKLEGS
jgi:replication factor A1